MALGVPGLRLTMGTPAAGTLDMVQKLTDVLLQRLGRVGSISSWFVYPLSDVCPEVVSIRHGMLIVDKTIRARI